MALSTFNFQLSTMLYINWQPDLEAFHIGSFAVRWYSLFWVFALVTGYFIVKWLFADQQIDPEIRKGEKVASGRFDPLFLYCFIGIVLGARLGHCIFYEPEQYLTSVKGVLEMIFPIQFKPDSWSFNMVGYSGLASHGGTIGIMLALFIYHRRKKMPLLTIFDNLSITAPLAACFIRLGNLMNSEIIGTQTDVPWAFMFHSHEAMVDGQLVPRHPSQLYEAIAYFIFFIAIIFIYMKSRKAFQEGERELYEVRNRISVGTGFYFGFCIVTIFTFRFFIEFLKERQGGADDGSTWLDMGQMLSIPFVLIGIWAMTRKYKKVES